MTAPMAAKTCVRLGTSGPAPPLHWKEISVDLLLRIRGEKKSPRQLAAAWYSASVGLGRWEPFLSFSSPAHALTHRASRSRRALGPGTGRFPRRGPRTMPRSLPGAGHRAGAPARPRLLSQRRVRCGSRARPPLLPHARLPSRRSGWVSGGRVPIMNEQSGDGVERSRARLPACLPRSRQV